MKDTKPQPAIGQGLSRVEGPLKVTGKALYTGDVSLPLMTYATTVRSTISRGRLVSVDSAAAMKVAGVLKILTPFNAPRLRPRPKSETVKMGEQALPLQSDQIHYNGQLIALVVATTFEAAQEAAQKVRGVYEGETPALRFDQPGVPLEHPAKNPKGQFLAKMRGDPAKAFASGGEQSEGVYRTPIEHHNPMEPSATVATWLEGSLLIYDATQAMIGQRDALAGVFGLAPNQCRVICPFVGGAFGCKGATWPHSIATALAAKVVGRPVKLVLSREDMFTTVGLRSQTEQRLKLAATSDGKLMALQHQASLQTSPVSDFCEPSVVPTLMLYTCPNLSVGSDLYRLNYHSPTFMRGPGVTTGVYAMEAAMDELSYRLGMDPLQLRQTNYAATHPDGGKLFSSKHLNDCYERGAERFGWQRRQPQPRSMRAGRYLVGLGMATATYPANHMPAEARAELFSTGNVVVSSASHDMGQGTYTILTQIAADSLGVDVGVVRCELGDSAFPKAPVSGGSQTAASVGAAVAEAARNLRDNLLQRAVQDPKSPHHRARVEALRVERGVIVRTAHPELRDPLSAVLSRASLPSLSAHGESKAKDDEGEDETPAHRGAEPGRTADPGSFSYHSFGAQFAEVRVDPDLGEVRVARLVGVFDIGRVLNAKTARSQGIGGMIMGIGMALMEQTVPDPKTGRFVTRNLADYLVPVHADAQDIEAYFIDVPDLNFTAQGGRGLGEIPLTGTAAAIANAVYHATGIRVRDLPITTDKLLGSPS